MKEENIKLLLIIGIWIIPRFSLMCLLLNKVLRGK